MLYQEGGALYDEISRTPAFNSAEGIRVLEYITDLVRDSLFYLNPGFQRQDEFLSGNVAMIPASIVTWAFIKDRPSFRMGVAPFPQGSRNASVIAGTNIGMFKKASPEQRKLAWEFIAWFLKPESQLQWTRASYYLPTRRSVEDLPGFKEFLKENPGYDNILAQLDFARTEPKTRQWFTGRIYLNEALEEALRLERTPKDALDLAAKRMRVDLE
jgi:multiple sugar transport system substrate-binding protein